MFGDCFGSSVSFSMRSRHSAVSEILERPSARFGTAFTNDGLTPSGARLICGPVASAV